MEVAKSGKAVFFKKMKFPQLGAHFPHPAGKTGGPPLGLFLVALWEIRARPYMLSELPGNKNKNG